MSAVGQSQPMTLADWLAWQEGLHDRRIDLGLERIRAVAERLAPLPPAPRVITVGGTNGKGSAVALLEAILRAAGYRVGCYTSPYLQRFTEQIRVDGAEVGEAVLCEAFQRVEATRGEVALTAFEFTTLAVLDLFHRSALDVAILEVGLGGRLDAVNVVDGDASLITTVDLDHQDWLGPDRESIGWHKAGIFRPGRVAVCADPGPPRRLLEHADAIGARLSLRDRDFGFTPVDEARWVWWGADIRLELPRPALPGEHQLANAAGVLALLHALAPDLPVNEAAIRQGLAGARLIGRLQIFPGPVQWWLDVAHNRQAIAALAEALAASPVAGRTLAVVAMRGDKDATALAALAGLVDVWYPASLPGARGREAASLVELIGDWPGAVRPRAHPDVLAACEAAAGDARQGDRIVVFGSFVTVATVLEADPMRHWNHG